jgi:hypothetical protein
VLRDLVSSLHALHEHIGASSFHEAASSLTARLIDAKSAADVHAFARSLAVIEQNLGQGSAAELGSRLVDRIKMERDPDLLRSYGEVLGSLPAGSLSAAQIESLAYIFVIPNAPCEIATLANGEENLGPLVRQILNPLCSERGWTESVVALDGLTKQSIVHGQNVYGKTAGASGNDTEADFEHLIVDDDDGEASAKAAQGIEVDFNKLSQVLATLRPREAISFWAVAAPVLSALLLLAGLLLCFLAWSNRTSRSAAPLLA